MSKKTMFVATLAAAVLCMAVPALAEPQEYTTSDGYTCDISTSYDYVWEGSGGTVYYSNNALDMPSGATRLSPR